MSNLAKAVAKDLEAWRPRLPMAPTTAYALHTRGVRAIACHTWLDGSYLKLSDSLPIKYTVHGRLPTGKQVKELKTDDHVHGAGRYEEYFERAAWVAVGVEE